MPDITANGTDHVIVRRVMTMVPRIPFAMPPPGSPTGWGRSTSRDHWSSFAPLITRSKKIRNSGRTTSNAQRVNTHFMTRSVALRRKVIVPVTSDPPRGARDHLRKDSLGREVHDERHQHQEEADQDERRKLETAGLGELIGDHRRHRVPLLEDGGEDLGPV